MNLSLYRTVVITLGLLIILFMSLFMHHVNAISIPFEQRKSLADVTFDNTAVAYLSFAFLAGVVLYLFIKGFFESEQQKIITETRREEERQEREVQREAQSMQHIFTYKDTVVTYTERIVGAGAKAENKMKDILAANPAADLKNYQTPLQINILSQERREQFGVHIGE